MRGGPRKLSSGREVARDISESLGKLPPQAPDLEEAILGALMLEKPAYEAVRSFLKPNHFYVEAHKIIYEAIVGLATEGIQEIDMRTVVQRLRSVGKLDLVEGAYKVAELTSKVSSAANIEYHARIVMEMAMKRHLIEIASEVHTLAYEDTTDVFELRDKVDVMLKVADDNTMMQSKEDKVRSLWETRLITEDPHEPAPLIMIDHCPIVQVGNHTLVVGKKKSRKTLYIVGLIAGYVKSLPLAADGILIFDTEQSKKHVFAIREKIHRLSGCYVNVFYLRGMHYTDRVMFIKQTIRYWRTKVTLVIIDGIRDLIGDILNSEESLGIITEMERLQLEHELAIIEVLHLNKTDSNARGHLGTELANKTIATIELRKDEKTGVTVVHCESSRDEPFEDYAFTHGARGTPDEGLPVGANMPRVEAARQITANNPENQQRLIAAFEPGAMSYADTWKAIGIHFQVGANRAKSMLAELVRTGQVIKNGKDRGPDTSYKLVSATPPQSAPVPPPAAITVAAPPADSLADQMDSTVDDLPF